MQLVIINNNNNNKEDLKEKIHFRIYMNMMKMNRLKPKYKILK